MAARASARRGGMVALRGDARNSLRGSVLELAGRGGSHPQVVEIQRSRLMSATIRAVEELGYTGVSVSDITGRARVSRRTFYELFSDREACLVAALGHAVGLIERELAGAELDGLSWRERVRLGLWTILSFFDREPVLARVCVVQALRGGPEVLELREGILTRLAAIVDEGRLEGARAAQVTPLTAEGLVGAASAVLYTRLLRKDAAPLTGLLGELTALIVLPYQGPAIARREQTRLAPEPLSGQTQESVGCEQFVSDPLQGIPIRLTYRTTRVLECVAAHPGVSNRQVGDHAEISDQGQVSKLLARLARVGLLVNTGKDRPLGEANAWELTPVGERVAESITREGARGEFPELDPSQVGVSAPVTASSQGALARRSERRVNATREPDHA